MKPALFIELNGPVLIPSHGNADPVLRAEISDYAKAFLHWATQHFHVAWLTDRSPRDAFHVAEKLGLAQDAVSCHGFDVSKIEVLDKTQHKNFAWLDSELIPAEVAWLAKHGHTDQFFSVDPLVGVTPEHKKQLEEFLRRK